MAYWLLKTEPTAFSYDDLLRLGRDKWDGVRNNAALIHLRAMRRGDAGLIYHTGQARRVVGTCRVVSDPYPEPGAGDTRFVVVDVEPDVLLPHPVPLATIRDDPAFAGWVLLRQSRLSVMPVPEPMWDRVLVLGGARAAQNGAGRGRRSGG